MTAELEKLDELHTKAMQDQTERAHFEFRDALESFYRSPEFKAMREDAETLRHIEVVAPQTVATWRALAVANWKTKP